MTREAVEYAIGVRALARSVRSDSAARRMVLARDAATASRQADCLARYERSCRSIERAQWLIVSLRAILDRGRPAFSGGGPDALPETLIRTRLRTLIDAGVLKPGGLGCLWEWRCRQPHPCGGCGALITKGQIEVEIITRGGVALILRWEP